MPDSRWQSPRVPPREAVLLLPNLPSQAEVLLREGTWSPALESWGITVQRDPAAVQPRSGTLVVARARAGAACGADMVMVDGRDRARHLRRAGYAVRTYTAHRAAAGAVVVRPLPALRSRRLPRPSSGQQVRRLLIEAVRSASGRRYLTIAHAGALTPFAVAAAAGSASTTLALVAGGGGPRRRSALLVGGRRDTRPHTVVKLGPVSGRSRGAKEQHVLRRLHESGLGDAVPRPLGEGTIGGVHWSAESAAPGRPLSDSMTGRSGRGTRDALARITAWFTALGAATRTHRVRSASDALLPLRGEHRRLGELRDTLDGVAGVLVHGDVGTGFNILLDGASFSVIDWETAVDDELPLTDVLPLVCSALSALHGHHRAREAAAYILRLCAGREVDSEWLLALIRGYCETLQVPLDKAGALAALAWGYQASMRLVHEELVMEAGGVATAWESAAEFVADAWLHQTDLGLSWRALTARAPA